MNKLSQRHVLVPNALLLCSILLYSKNKQEGIIEKDKREKLYIFQQGQIKKWKKADSRIYIKVLLNEMFLLTSL